MLKLIFVLILLPVFVLAVGCSPAQDTPQPENGSSSEEISVPELNFRSYDDGLAVVYMGIDASGKGLFLAHVGRTYAADNTMSGNARGVLGLDEAEEGLYKLPMGFPDMDAEGILQWAPYAYAVVREGGQQILYPLSEYDPSLPMSWEKFYTKYYTRLNDTNRENEESGFEPPRAPLS